MTIFQAIVTELYPKLQGASFNRKVQDFETKWGANFVDLNDSRRLYDLFGVGIQAWTRIRQPDRRTLGKRVFDTFYKKKVIIELDDFSEDEPINIRALVWYIFDVKCLNYFMCPKRYCNYGTNRYNLFQNHVQVCRDETLVKYKQTKKAAPDQDILKALAEEKILPSEDFQNTMFCTFDIGKFIH